MNERVHGIIDGELPRGGATADERDEVVQAEATIGAVLRSIPTEPLPDLAPAILDRIARLPNASAAVRAGRSTWWSRLGRWCWAPRPLALTWRPAYALALLLLVPLFTRPSGLSAPADPQLVLVQFRLDAPQASDVALAGSFSDWQPRYHLTRTAGGVWTVTIPLQQGVHKYAFVLDGRTWQVDPLAPSVSDGFGGQNSQIAVLTPELSEET